MQGSKDENIARVKQRERKRADARDAFVGLESRASTLRNAEGRSRTLGGEDKPFVRRRRREGERAAGQFVMADLKPRPLELLRRARE